MSDGEYDPNQGYPPIQQQTPFAPSKPLEQQFKPNEYAKPVA